MFHVPGLKYLLIDRYVSELEAAASRERLATEARKWSSARALTDSRVGSRMPMLRQLADRGNA